MSKKRSVAEIRGALALAQARQKAGKPPGREDQRAMRRAYHKGRLPTGLRKEIEELARSSR